VNGSQLVLQTDGLLEDRTDIDVGMERLRQALDGSGRRTPEETAPRSPVVCPPAPGTT
jgi:hypothetical protein